MSLDRDLKNLRRSKYTPQASSMVREWISSTLNESLPEKDLMDILRDGTILCRLANHVGDKQIRFKTSQMPFVQMENISHFLNFITGPPISLAPHDRFLTVDLFDKKDPAQVVQCLSAFSRAAHAHDPARFPETIGGLKGGVAPISTSSLLSSSALSPAPTASPCSPLPRTPLSSPGRASAASTPTATSPTPGKKPGVVTAWNKKEQEGTTIPAWNVVQYGYMGGASQNQGISFGSRRQITQTPVISDFEKRRAVEREERDKLRKQQQEEAEELRKKQDDLKAKEAEVRKQREEEKRQEDKTRIAEDEDEKRKRSYHVESSAILRQEREKELQEKKREKELKDALEEAERAKRREQELREAKEEAERRRRHADDLARRREAERVERERFEATEEDSIIDDYIHLSQHNQKIEYDQDPLLRERERVRQLERELEEARRRERMYAAARGELAWDPAAEMGRMSLQSQDSQDDLEDALDRFEIPRRKLPTPPPLSTKRSHPQLLSAHDEGETRKSWEAGDDKRPLDSPTKQSSSGMLKWGQRPSSRGQSYTTRPLPTSPPSSAMRSPPRTTMMSIPPIGERPVFKPMSFLERERERERLRQKEWEKEHMHGM